MVLRNSGRVGSRRFFLGSPVSIMMQGFFVVYDLMNVAVSKNINKPTINKLIYAHPCLLGDFYGGFVV